MLIWYIIFSVLFLFAVYLIVDYAKFKSENPNTFSQGLLCTNCRKYTTEWLNKGTEIPGLIGRCMHDYKGDLIVCHKCGSNKFIGA